MSFSTYFTDICGRCVCDGHAQKRLSKFGDNIAQTTYKIYGPTMFSSLILVLYLGSVSVSWLRTFMKSKSPAPRVSVLTLNVVTPIAHLGTRSATTQTHKYVYSKKKKKSKIKLFASIAADSVEY